MLTALKKSREWQKRDKTGKRVEDESMVEFWGHDWQPKRFQSLRISVDFYWSEYSLS